MSAIRMSSGFGSSGLKRTPEKVVMEPSGIQPKNHAGYNEHNTHLLFSATHTRGAVPWDTKGLNLRRWGGQLDLPLGWDAATVGTGASPRAESLGTVPLVIAVWRVPGGGESE